jgi:DNA repair protein RadC
MRYQDTAQEEIGESSDRGSLERFARSPRLAEIRAVYRSRKKAPERPKIRGPRDSEAYVRAAWDKDTLELVEEFLVVCLDGHHQALGWVKVSSGGFNGTQVDPRVIFAIALQTAATAIVVAHNHPSGSLEPSEQDKAVTRRLKEAGNLLGIALLDHVILTRDSALSFVETGLL